MRNNLNYSKLSIFTDDQISGLGILSSIVGHLNDLSLPISVSLLSLGFLFLGLLLLGFFLLRFFLLVFSLLVSALLVVVSSISVLGLLSNLSSSGLTLVVLRHHVAVVTNDSARSVPGLVDTDTVNGADVQVSLAVNTTNRFIFSVAGAVFVNNDLAGLGSCDLDDQNRVAGGSTGISISASISSANRGRTELSAVLETLVDFSASDLLNLLNSLAGSIVSDGLANTLSRAFVLISVIISTANGQVNLGADTDSLRRRRQAGTLRFEFSLVAFHVANVIVGLSITSTNGREVANTVNAFLNGSVIASTIESLLNLLASEIALVDVVATINTANRLVNESTAAGSFAGLNGEEGSSSASHNTAILVASSIGTTNSILSVAAFANLVGSRLVVEVVARTDLDANSSVALSTAQIAIGHTIVSANRVEVGVARASVGSSGSSISHESGILVLSKGINGLSRSFGGRTVGTNAPSVVSLGNATKTQEAVILVGFAIDTTDRAIDNGASSLGGKVVWLSDESRYVD